MGSKHCTRCGIERPLSAFTPRPNRPCGYQSICRVCYTAAATIRRRAAPKPPPVAGPVRRRRFPPIETRLLSCVDMVPEGGCWIWTGRTWGRYGQVYYAGRQQTTHRVSYQIFRGRITEGLIICHRCDNPLCINPHHLFIGTQRDNMLDAARKGRVKIGGHIRWQGRRNANPQ